MRNVWWLSCICVLAACNTMPEKELHEVDEVTITDEDLMRFYKGFHQVGVRLLSENAGAGGRANLNQFYALYFNDEIESAIEYLGMSLFADPFNENSRVVAAQVESQNLFGLLSQGSQERTDVKTHLVNGQANFLELSKRIYGTEHYAVLLQRYNQAFNEHYPQIEIVLAPELALLPVIGEHFQKARPVRQVTRVERPRSDVVRSQPVPPPRVPTEPVAAVPDEASESARVEIVVPPVTPEQLHQQGRSSLAYQRLRAQSEAERNTRLYEQLREELVDQPYREGVSYFHDQEVEKAVVRFKQVLRLEPSHQRAQDYLERALKLSERLTHP